MPVRATARPSGAIAAKLKEQAPTITPEEKARLELNAASEKIPSSMRDAAMNRTWKGAFLFDDKTLQQHYDSLPGRIF